ncbi:MAG: zinc ribbon domain-containing protein [Alphaproteobacteria bacterium]|nr:zinc ribbon domain-containing protein [Alphaproteobacteria bacterium]
MALIVCPECRKKVSDTAAACPGCGYSLTPEKVAEIRARNQQSLKGCGIGCLVVLGFVLLVAMCSGSSSNNPSTSTSIPDKPHEIVENSEWDGSVFQVKEWLNENLKDPDSLEFINWSPVQKTKTGYMVRAKYRAKNSFGGYVIENKIFILDSSGHVVSAMDYPE